MALENRLTLYNTHTINGNQELDYLDSAFAGKTFLELTRHTVSQEDIGRLDLVSFYFYNTPALWWLIAQQNNMIDINNEMYVGMTLSIPDINDYYDFYNVNI